MDDNSLKSLKEHFNAVAAFTALTTAIGCFSLYEFASGHVGLGIFCAVPTVVFASTAYSTSKDLKTLLKTLRKPASAPESQGPK